MVPKNKIKESDVHILAACFLKREPRSISRTGFKGVTRRGNRFYVLVWRKDLPKRCIGGFATAKEAAKAYDTYVRDNIGDWPYTNFVKGTNQRTK